jgi:hypothetical protein
MDPNLEACLSVEISADRHWTSVVAVAEHDGNYLVEVVRYTEGSDTARVVQQVAEQLYVVGLAIAQMGGASTLVRPLTDMKLAPTLASEADKVLAHNGFLDAWRAGKLRLVDHPALHAALRAADQRPRGDRYTLDVRGAAVDQSPLVAAELGLWCLQTLPPAPPEPDIF